MLKYLFLLFVPVQVRMSYVSRIQQDGFLEGEFIR